MFQNLFSPEMTAGISLPNSPTGHPLQPAAGPPEARPSWLLLGHVLRILFRFPSQVFIMVTQLSPHPLAHSQDYFFFNVFFLPSSKHPIFHKGCYLSLRRTSPSPQLILPSWITNLYLPCQQGTMLFLTMAAGGKPPRHKWIIQPGVVITGVLNARGSGN